MGKRVAESSDPEIRGLVAGQVLDGFLKKLVY